MNICSEMIKKPLKESILESRIFIVDDQIKNLILLENVLESAGFGNIWSTTDERELLPKLKTEKPAILLIDLMMPHISGYELIKSIRKDSEKDTLPILVLTADISSESKHQAFDLGANDFLTKPFDIREVISRVQNLITASVVLDQLQNQNIILEEMVEEKTAYLKAALDLTEKRERYFRVLFNSSFDAILYFNLQEEGPSNFFECNPAAEAILGYTKEELAGLSIKDLDCDYSDDYYFKIKEQLSSKSETLFLERKIKINSGECRIMETSFVSMEVLNKIQTVVFLRDVTEKVEQIETILNQNKIFKEIAWSQSHEVRAPLARMMGVIDLIDDELSSELDEETASFIKIIKDSSHELDQIIRKISEKSNVAQSKTNVTLG